MWLACRKPRPVVSLQKATVFLICLLSPPHPAPPPGLSHTYQVGRSYSLPELSTKLQNYRAAQTFYSTANWVVLWKLSILIPGEIRESAYWALWVEHRQAWKLWTGEHRVSSHKREEDMATSQTWAGVVRPPKGWLGTQTCRLLVDRHKCYWNTNLCRSCPSQD